VTAITTKRKVFARLSIISGNALQAAGIVAASFCLWSARTAISPAMAFGEMVLAWILLYFSAHGIAHWIVGRAVVIGFRFYTVGGTGNPEAWPPGIRWYFEDFPFF
jgi:hypothetical protein